MLVKQKIKYIQSLGQKKFREANGLFIAEGPKLVSDLVAAQGEAVREIYALREWIDEQAAIPAHIALYEITAADLERISQLATPNKVLAVVQQYASPVPAARKGSIILALDSIQDPGNMGTIIRIADWFGVEQVVCNEGTADIYNPKVVQATMGSIARVQVCYTNLEAWLADQEGTRIYAAALEGQPIGSMKKINEGVIIIGNEANGISPGILQHANVKITIPRKGKAESLNAAVATGIILHQLQQ